jgi:spore germination protein KC
MKNHPKAIVLLFLFILVLTGCQDTMEIDRITFPVALGIDWNEESHRIQIYAQVSTLSTQVGGQTQNEKAYKVLEGKGETLAMAMDDITDHSQQYVSWKHVIVVVVSKEMAEHGIIDEIDHLIRLEQTHLNCYLLLTEENLNDLFESTPKIESGLSTPLAGISLISELNTHSKVVTLKDFIMPYLCKETAPVIPLISIFKLEEKQNQKEIEFDYKGLGVFINDRLTGRLDENETLGLIMISGIKHQGSIAVPYPGNKDKSLSLRELVSKTKIIPNLQGGKPGITLEIHVEYDVLQDPVSNKMDVGEVNKINTQVQSYVKSLVEAVVKKAQTDLKVDIFGFGGEIDRKYPDYWLKNEDNWLQIFPKVNVEVEVKAELDNTGDLINSLRYKFRRD